LQRFAVWLVAEFEVPSYQGTPMFEKGKTLETFAKTAINYTACWLQLVI